MLQSEAVIDRLRKEFLRLTDDKEVPLFSYDPTENNRSFKKKKKRRHLRPDPPLDPDPTLP